LEELKLCRYIFAGTVGLGAGLAFMLKRSDIRLYNEKGELAYGLSYPDSLDKSIGAADFPAWLAKARAEGPVAMLLRDREMEVGPLPDAIYRRGHLVLLIFRQEKALAPDR
jgi:4-amino-4-deoxy-L-arabinose transferase